MSANVQHLNKLTKDRQEECDDNVSEPFDDSDDDYSLNELIYELEDNDIALNDSDDGASLNDESDWESDEEYDDK